MAQIRERLRKNGKKSFFVRIRMKRQPEVTASFDRLTDARIWASSTENSMREGGRSPLVQFVDDELRGPVT